MSKKIINFAIINNQQNSPSEFKRMDVKKVLLISQEIDPYITHTDLGSFSRNMAQKLQEKGAEVRSFMPKYGAINERRNQLHEVIRLSGLNIVIDDTDHPLIIKVATLQPTRLQVYFIDNDDYFCRHLPAASLETVEQAETNDERTIFFVRGVIETVKKLRWNPDLVVCVGWVSALVPLYLKTIYGEDPAFQNTKIVYTIAGDKVEGSLDERMAGKLKEEGLSDDLLGKISPDGKFDYSTLHKIGIDCADAIVDSLCDTKPAIAEYAQASGKPMLVADSPDVDFFNFYQSI